MPVSVAIKFTQGANTDSPGVAVVGTLVDGAVTVTNGDNTDIVNWTITLESAPIGSALVEGTLATGNDGNPTVDFTPDVSGSYLVSLTADDDTNPAISDDLVFGVPNTAGWIVPAAGARGEAHNFSNQARGWSGTDSIKLLDGIFADILPAASVITSVPANPGDDNKVFIASGGVVTYSQISNIHIDPAANIAFSKLSGVSLAAVMGVGAVTGATLLMAEGHDINIQGDSDFTLAYTGNAASNQPGGNINITAQAGDINTGGSVVITAGVVANPTGAETYGGIDFKVASVETAFAGSTLLGVRILDHDDTVAMTFNPNFDSGKGSGQGHDLQFYNYDTYITGVTNDTTGNDMYYGGFTGTSDGGDTYVLPGQGPTTEGDLYVGTIDDGDLNLFSEGNTYINHNSGTLYITDDISPVVEYLGFTRAGMQLGANNGTGNPQFLLGYSASAIGSGFASQDLLIRGESTTNTFAGHIIARPGSSGSSTNGQIQLMDDDGALKITIDDGGIGFFAATPFAQPSAYTVTNPVSTRSFDTTTVTLSSLAEVVGTVIRDFGGSGATGYGLFQ